MPFKSRIQAPRQESFHKTLMFISQKGQEWWEMDDSKHRPELGIRFLIYLFDHIQFFKRERI